jgi:MarR family
MSIINMKKISHDFSRDCFLTMIYSGDMSVSDERTGNWTLLTGHGHVLVEIARNPGARVRDISAVVGLTERTVQAVVADLAAAGYLTRTRTGRRTRYTVNSDHRFRHPAQEGLRIGPFLAALAASGDDRAPEPAADPAVAPESAPESAADPAAEPAPADQDRPGPRARDPRRPA